MTTFVDKNWDELTAEQQDFATVILAGLSEHADNVVSNTKTLEEAKAAIRDLGTSMNRIRTLWTFAMVGLTIMLAPVGLALFAYYYIKVRPLYEAGKLERFAVEEILEYKYRGQRPDSHWGNKIQWSSDTFGDVVEKILGLRTGNATVNYLEYLWDRPELAKKVWGWGECGAGEDNNSGPSLSETIKGSEEYKAAKKAAVSFGKKVAIMALAQISLLGVFGGLVLYFGFEHAHRTICYPVGGPIISVISFVVFIYICVQARRKRW